MQSNTQTKEKSETLELGIPSRVVKVAMKDMTNLDKLFQVAQKIAGE